MNSLIYEIKIINIKYNVWFIKLNKSTHAMILKYYICAVISKKSQNERKRC